MCIIILPFPGILNYSKGVTHCVNTCKRTNNLNNSLSTDLPCTAAWGCKDLEHSVGGDETGDFASLSQDPELCVPSTEESIGPGWNCTVAHPWTFGTFKVGPCCIKANWYGLQKGAYRVNGIWSGACQGTSGTGVYKVGFHEAFNAAEPWCCWKCFSFGCRTRFLCCLSKVFLAGYNCLLTWSRRSINKKFFFL